jgi:predicted RNase H-like nuclease (RuvC/YqgF family)
MNEMFDNQPKQDMQTAGAPREVAELRGQLLRYTRKLDEADHLVAEQRRCTEELRCNVEELRHNIEQQRQQMEALAADVQAWRTFRTSRAYRMLGKYRAMYDLPVIGSGIRAARRFAGRLRSLRRHG